MKPEPKWVSYSIIIGGIIMFSNIFLSVYIKNSWWILQILGALILFVPWLLWKPMKGELTFTSNCIELIYDNKPPIQIDFKDIENLRMKFEYYNGQTQGIFSILSSFWPNNSGYENLVTIRSNKETFTLGVYADNEIQLKNIAAKFELLQDIIKREHTLSNIT